MKDKSVSLLAALGVAFLFVAPQVLAHPGNTAGDGCHYCRTNCAKWGEVEDARHCHGGGVAVPDPIAIDLPIEPIPVPVSTPVPATPKPVVTPMITPRPTIQPTSKPTARPTVAPTPISTLIPSAASTPIPSPTPESTTETEESESVVHADLVDGEVVVAELEPREPVNVPRLNIFAWLKNFLFGN